MQVLHLQKAAKATPLQRKHALSGFFLHWEEMLAKHFEEEESLLPPLLKDLPEWKTMLGDHEQLRALVAQARTVSENPGSAFLEKLAQTLHDHIRWEERNLFPILEKQITEKQFAELGKIMKEREATRARSQNHGFCR